MTRETPGEMMRRLLDLPVPTDSKYLTVIFDSEDGPVYVHIPKGMLSAIEEGKVIQLGGKYWGRLDQPHVTSDQEHLHLYARGKGQPLIAINVDGTVHHHGSTNRIPNKAADGIRKHLPHFKVPDDNIYEWMSADEEKQLLFG
jgi:hypothetical protein